MGVGECWGWACSQPRRRCPLWRQISTMSAGWPPSPKSNCFLSVLNRGLHNYCLLEVSTTIPMFCPQLPHSLVGICPWHDFAQPGMGTSSSSGSPTPATHSRFGLGGGKAAPGGEAGPWLQPACPAGTQRRTKAAVRGVGWAVAGLEGPLAPAAGCLSPCQGPVGHTRASGLGRACGGVGPPRAAPPGDSAPSWVSPGKTTAACGCREGLLAGVSPRVDWAPGRRFLNLIFLICIMGLITQV